MLLKRIIPCLDIFNGRVIKGVNFKNLIDIGDPVDVVRYYEDEGADEIVVLDISATIENKTQTFNMINSVSYKISIPLTVGGGVRSLNDIEILFNSGADKISLNTYIIDNFNFIKTIKFKYGSQCIVAAIDVKKYLKNNCYFWDVYKKSGKVKSHYNLFDVILRYNNIGVGEILLTSMDKDGTKKGFDNELYERVSKLINVNIISSGGGSDLSSILNILKINNINAALMASVLHNKKYSIFFIKNFLINNGINVRI